VLGLEETLQVALFGRAGASLLMPLGIVVSIVVTVHVLLRKREVGASIGWMGLAWLSPFIGGLLYLLLGINRVSRRARELRGRRRSADRTAPGADVPAAMRELAPLSHAAGRVTGRPLLEGNAVEVLPNGDAAYPRMLQAIAEAERSVALASYILRDDAAGGRFLDALIAAHDRGVAVRVLIDGIGSGYFRPAAYHRLRRHGVPAGLFMHSLLPWRMPFLNLRSHRKILVADGRVGFTGGMNIGAENLIGTAPRRPVRDMQFRLAGPVVGQLMEAFAQDWVFVTGERLTGEAWFPPLKAAGPTAGRVVTSGPDADIQKIEFLAMEAIACARRSVRIATPYFLPDERLITAFALAGVRGVKVDIVLPEVNDHRVMDWALRGIARPLLDQGCRIWLNPPPFEHTKLMVVDEAWCMIGGCNWDMRSFRLNFELNVEFYCADLAGRLAAMIDARKGRRLTLPELDGRPLPERLRDAAVRLLLPYL
jgi:cardiolipin synthase